MKHVCLIFTPIDHTYRDAATHFSPPLGLVALENYIKQKLPNVKVSILDGSVVHSMDEILKFIDHHSPDIVAQSIQLISYENALTIAKYSKTNGAITVVGGHQATQLATEIVSRQEGIIDYVVVNDGEEAIVGLLTEKEPAHIPNLVFLNNGIVKKTKSHMVDLHLLPPIDYSNCDFAPYDSLLSQAQFDSSTKISRYLRIYSHKGCSNRGNSSACVFCGRADRGVRFKTPSQFWLDMENVITNCNADYVFDVGDDFLCIPKWLEQVALQKPKFSKQYQLGIFGRANRVTSEVAGYLKIIGVTDVVIGFESGDERVLELCGKKNTNVRTNAEAACCLFQNGIDICASYVLGLPGENEESLMATIDSAKEIAKIAERYLGRPPRELVANLIEPSPGSPVYKGILKSMPEKYSGKDILSLEELQRDYYRVYFGLETLHEYNYISKENKKTELEKKEEVIKLLIQ